MRRRRAALIALSEKLLVKETLERDEIDDIVTKAEEEVEVDEVPSTKPFGRLSRAGV
jgi:hypothetical protein